MQPRLPDRIRLPFTFDPALLARDLARFSSGDWIKHFVPQNYDGDWSIVPLRSKAGATHPIMMIYSDPAATEFENTALLAGSPYFQHVLSSFRCPLRAARLMRLTPGSLIKEHSDHELSAEEGFARLHIPVTTNPDVEFFLNGSRVILEAGSTWYLRLSDPHRVHNRGATDRVHIVIDAVVDAWLRDLLESSLKKAA